LLYTKYDISKSLFGLYAVWTKIFAPDPSGIGGGMMRDILASDTPFVLRSELYAMAAFADGAIVATGYAIGILQCYSMLLGATVCIFLRLIAIYRGWRAPVAHGSIETKRGKY
jgi:uncharacterized membrane protein YeiH